MCLQRGHTKGKEGEAVEEVKGGGKGGDKGSKSSNPPPTESAPDTVPAAESTATDKPDILDLTTEEQEVEARVRLFFCMRLT